MKVQAGTVTSLNPDHVDITGPGYHIRVKEAEPDILLITSLTDDCRNQLVVRPRSCNEILLSHNLVVSSACPHRVLDAAALDSWMGMHYHNLLVHWQTYEADKMDLWEWVYDHHPDLWKEFEQSFREVPDEKT